MKYKSIKKDHVLGAPKLTNKLTHFSQTHNNSSGMEITRFGTLL